MGPMVNKQSLTPNGEKEFLAWLESYGLPSEVQRFAEQMIEGQKTACEEIIRLRGVIHGHASPLAQTISDHVEVSALEVIESGCRVRVTSQLHEIRIPYDIRTWSREHQSAFIKGAAEVFGRVVAKRFAEELWPGEPVSVARPQGAQSDMASSDTAADR